MRVLFNKKFLDHNTDSPAEGRYRLANFPEFYDDEEADGEKFISLVHTPSYIEKIKKACSENEVLAEVRLNPKTWEAAKSAVGLSIMASLQGDFAAIRPPGHHAKADCASGFCFFNNIAIAAQNLVNKGKKVMIIDIDGHHGDGTQDIFYHSDKVFYASIHQAFTFPFTGNASETGEGKGKGYTLNIPVMPGCKDGQFLKVIEKLIKAGYQFQPDVVGVSAGFDTYKNDRLLDFKITKKGFYECGFRLRRSFKNVFAVLEGGYHTELKECIESFVNGINVGSRPIKSTFDHEMSIG